MPAQSQQQQKLFGLALSVKRGETPRSEASKEVLDIVDSMTEKEIEDFASTSHSGLPSKVESQLRDAVREIMRERVLSESVTEAISRDAAYIHGILQTGQDAAQNFIDDNGLDGEKLSDYVKANRNNIDGYNVKHYISGERGTVGSVPKLRQAFIKKFKKGKSVNEDVSKYTNAGISKFAVAIASLTATRPDVVQKFVDTHNLNIEKLYQFLKKENSKSRFGGFAMDFVTALSGKPGNPIQKKLIKMFQESVNEENEPTNPELWDRAIAAAKREYDVYPSAYANAFASKWYKDKGGDWKTKKESVNEGNSSVEIGDIIFFPPANSAATVIDRFGRSVTLKLANGKKVKTVVDKVKLLAQDGVNEHKDCGCGCGGVTEGGCGTSLTEGQLNEWKAEEVLQQLGGRKFIAMTGANNFVKDDKAKSIIFKLPRAKSGIKYVRITLTSMDVYNIEFISVRGSNIKTVATAKGVYNDELQSVFTQYTGLYTSL